MNQNRSPQYFFLQQKIASPENRRLRRQRLPLVLLAAALAAMMAASAHAQSSYTWTGGGGTNGGDWETAANWGGTAPASLTANLHFAGTTETTTTNNYAAYGHGFQIYFDSGAGAFTLSGSAINFYDYSTVNPAIENDSTSTQTVNLQVDMEDTVSNAVMNINATNGNINLGTSSGNGFSYYNDVSGDTLALNTGTGNTITVNGTISNGNATAAVSINGSGTVVFNGGNNFTGATTIAGGATLQMGTGGTTGQDLDTSGITDNGTLVIDRTGNVTQKAGSSLGGAISGTGSVIIESGTAVYSASSSNYVNTYSGTTTVQTGAGLTLGLSTSIENSALNTSGGGTVTLTPTTLTVGGLYGSTNLATLITSGYSGLTALTLNPGTGASNTYSGTIANGAAGMTLSMSGAGTQTLSGASTYTGSTTVSAGTLIVTGSLSGTSSTTVDSGATLEIDGSSNVASTTTINGVNASGQLQGTGKLGAITANGGTVAPGYTTSNATTAVGTLTAAGAVSLTSTSTFAIRLGLGGVNNTDQLAETSGVFNPNDATLSLSLFGLSAPSNNGNMYTIVNGGATGTYSGSNLFYYGGSAVAEHGTFNVSSGGNTYKFEAFYDDGTSGAGNIALELVAVPEPGSWGMLFGGFGVLISIQRLRKHQAGA